MSFHGDIDSSLSEYNDKSFDYLILNQSLQQIRHVDPVLKDALRVGRRVIVGFPNFAYYPGTAADGFSGAKSPMTGALPYQWYESPNLHFLSISDFVDYCRSKEIRIERRFFTNGSKRLTLLPNLLAQVGIFFLLGTILFCKKSIVSQSGGINSTGSEIHHVYLICFHFATIIRPRPYRW